jgi:hypothetical protein
MPDASPSVGFLSSADLDRLLTVGRVVKVEFIHAETIVNAVVRARTDLHGKRITSFSLKMKRSQKPMFMVYDENVETIIDHGPNDPPYLVVG